MEEGGTFKNIPFFHVHDKKVFPSSDCNQGKTFLFPGQDFQARILRLGPDENRWLQPKPLQE